MFGYPEMIPLGNFKYHIYEIVFEGRDDEKEYRVTKFQETLTEVRHGLTIVKPEVSIFSDIGSARDAFEAAVKDVIFRTSRSDVSLYQQNFTPK